MNYSYNDNEILYLINEDPEQYQYILFTKYKPIIYSIALEFYNCYKGLGLSFDDLLQESYIGFNNAINSYNSTDSLFYTFSIICIKRNLISYIRFYTKKGNAIINDSLGDEYFYYIKCFDDDIFNSIWYEYDFVNYKNKFDNDENYIFELLINGFSSKEISILLDIPINKVYQLSYKVKSCLKKHK